MIDKNLATAIPISYYIEIGEGENIEEKQVILNSPSFEQMLQAMSLMKDNSMISMVKAGRELFNLCAVSYDEAFNDNSTMMSLCMKLADELVLPELIEVKKK